MTQPRVSVITIFYNAENFLREAVESVLEQGFADFELLLVDDGSKDSSLAIAQEYASIDERVKCLWHSDRSNRGMSAARNLGLRKAQGNYVAFIDADDRWRPTKLKDQVELLDRNPGVDAVGGTVNYWVSHSGGKNRLIRTAHVRGRIILPGEATLKLYPLGKAHAPSMSDLMFRRLAIEEAGSFEEAFTGAYEDQAFLAKFYLNSSMLVTDSVWSDYRLHGESCMAKVKQDGSYSQARIAFLKWFDIHLEKVGYPKDDARRLAVRRALQAHETRGLREILAESALGPVVRAGKARLRELCTSLAPGPAILMYHRIADESFDPWALAVSPGNFADQLAWIWRNRTVLPLGEFCERNRSGRLPKDAVAITFDDGYASTKDFASPLLQEFGVPATIFLPTDLIELGREFWWDELERMILDDSVDVLQLHGRMIQLGQSDPADKCWTPATPPKTRRQRAYHELWNLLYEMEPLEIAKSMDELRRQTRVEVAPRQSHRLLKPTEIRELRNKQIEFGSHALSHPSLPRLDTKSKEREIRLSIDSCADLAGVVPRTFAYPFGNYDHESERLVEQSGFLCACKADGGFVTPNSDSFALPRILVGNWSSDNLARQLGSRRLNKLASN